MGAGRRPDGPLLLVVSDDESVRANLTADLDRRFGLDYRVTATSSSETLAFLRGPAADLAVLIVDERVADPSATELFLQVHARFPGAKRVQLIKRGNWSSRHPRHRRDGPRARSTTTSTTRGPRWSGSSTRR